MRLLHVRRLQLYEFKENETPRYAILSHTWGKDEFLFEHVNEIDKHLEKPKRGLEKILGACDQAKRDGLDYLWVDTCCIDKSSSSELSQALNSMFKWYKNSATCYAFLEDATMERDGVIRNFDRSKWFTRGWTLQELIAPHGLFFFDSRWTPIATRYSLSRRISEITGIRESFIRREHTYGHGHDDVITDMHCKECKGMDSLEPSLRNEPAAGKLKWAENRATTVEEDMSYCLMGLFDVNMPLLYGEGKKAFLRLQEEILKDRPDQSILASTDPYLDAIGDTKRILFLARSPSAFTLELNENNQIAEGQGDIVRIPRGLEIDVLLIRCTVTQYGLDEAPDWLGDTHLAVLSCTTSADRLSRVAIFVLPSAVSRNSFFRILNTHLVLLEPGKTPRVIGSDDKSESSRISVACDVNDFRPSKILLRNSEEHNIRYSLRPSVKMKIRGYRNWSLKAEYPSLNKEGVLERCFERLEDRHGLQLIILGVFFFVNNSSSFVVLLAVDRTPDKVYSTNDTPYFSWFEPFDTFIGREFSRMRLDEVTPKTLEEALQIYLDDYHDRAFKKPASKLRGPHYQAETYVETTGFLDRLVETVVVDIEPLVQREYDR